MVFSVQAQHEICAGLGMGRDASSAFFETCTAYIFERLRIGFCDLLDNVSHSMTTTTHQGHFAFDMGSGNEGLMPPTSLLRDENAHGHVQVPRSILPGVSSICSMLCLTVMCFSD